MEIVDEEDQAEQTDDDGRHRADRFLGEPDGACDPVVAGVLGHVYAGQNAHRNGDQHGQNQDVDRVPQDGHDPAQGGAAWVAEDEARRYHSPGGQGEVEDDGSEDQDDEDPGAP